MHSNCFYDTFFSRHKALDKYNICAKINTLRPYIAKLQRLEQLAFTDNPGQNCWNNSIYILFSNFCALLLSPPERESKPPPHPLFSISNNGHSYIKLY